MKYNTYDIPSIKFFCIFGERRDTVGKIRNNEIVFSFDDIDGLSIKAIKELFKDVMKYGKYDYKQDDYKYLYITSTFIIKDLVIEKAFTFSQDDYHLTISLILPDDIEDRRIDEYIEEIILNNYNEMTEKNPVSKVIRCFLQRYRYNTMEEVDEVLKTRTPKKRIHVPE